jgi:hypothetical protein
MDKVELSPSWVGVIRTIGGSRGHLRKMILLEALVIAPPGS